MDMVCIVATALFLETGNYLLYIGNQTILRHPLAWIGYVEKENGLHSTNIAHLIIV